MDQRFLTALVVLGGLAGCPSSLAAVHSAGTGSEPPQAAWEQLIGFTTGVGYKDNVTLAHQSPEESALLSASLEYFALRLPADSTQFDLFLLAEETRFLSSSVVDDERIVFGQARLRTDTGDGWEPWVALETIYQDQVLDVSITEAELRTVQVEGLTLGGRPGFKRDWGRIGWTELSVPVRRQIFRTPLDDYWEFGPEVVWGFPYGNRSEAELSYEFSRRNYDEDEARTAEGALIPGSHRAFERHELGVSWRHYWDAGRRWRTTTRGSWLVNRDNASGYFDYDRFRVSEDFRWDSGKWECSAGVRLAYYDYRIQAVSADDPEGRERWEWQVEARVQRELARYVSVYVAWEREQTLSNLTLDEYTVNQFTAGLSWEF